jgi:hypothetical protein
VNQQLSLTFDELILEKETSIEGEFCASGDDVRSKMLLYSKLNN